MGLFILHDEMYYEWDGASRYIYEWFVDGWEAQRWYQEQENLPRAIENVIENNISPYRSWDVWDGDKGVFIIPFRLDALRDYVINHITKGTAREAK